MRTLHPFLLQPGKWLGEGKITFSASPEQLRFFTRWMIEPTQNSEVQCIQEVQMEGMEEKMVNSFSLKEIKQREFSMTLENELMGIVYGKGIIEKQTVGWEFRNEEFEGFEIYHYQETDQTYIFHAEYASKDQFRTIIDGTLWKAT